MTLLDFCTTDRQREIIELHIEGMSSRKIAKRTGVDDAQVRGVVRHVKKTAADRNYCPEFGRDVVMPEGQIVSGYSDLVRYPDDDPSGRVLGWIKTNRKLADQLQEAQVVAESMAAEITPRKPAVYRGNVKKNHHFSVLPVGDPHIGLRTWSREVGQDWDVPIALRVYEKVFTRLLERAPDTETCVLFNSGDFFHADNMAGETARSGHKLDLDGRPGYWLQAGVEIITMMIDMCLAKYKEVHFVNTPGNHDDILSLALGVFMRKLYSNEPRFSCQVGNDSFQYFERGKVAIGFCHGHTCKLASLPGKMATDMAEMWGRTTYRHWLTGHVHHNQFIQFKEYPGCTVESVGIIPPKDAYAHGAGYGANRGTQLIIMDDRGYMPTDRLIESVQETD